MEENKEDLKDLNTELQDEKENIDENNEVEAEIVEEETLDDDSSKEKEDELAMFKKTKDENIRLKNELETLKDRLLRVTAEYENYRKRTAKEKEGIYTDACNDVLKELVPVLDNLERAVAAEGNLEDLKKGVEMTVKGFQNSLEKLGVEEIDTTKGFDPNFHQAVMHIEDENYGPSEVAEVFMKGYKKGDKVIRHSVVKVAN